MLSPSKRACTISAERRHVTDKDTLTQHCGTAVVAHSDSTSDTNADSNGAEVSRGLSLTKALWSPWQLPAPPVMSMGEAHAVSRLRVGTTSLFRVPCCRVSLALPRYQLLRRPSGTLHNETHYLRLVFCMWQSPGMLPSGAHFVLLLIRPRAALCMGAASRHQ